MSLSTSDERAAPSRRRVTGDPAAASAIVTAGLTRRFDTLVAVDALDLAIPTGAIFGLLGTNGAGKTTVIKMLTTLLPPSSGNRPRSRVALLRLRA